MFENWFWRRAKSFAKTSGRIPNYEIQNDGTIKVKFVDPDNTDTKAYDTEISPKQQITVAGYANAIDLETKIDELKEQENPDVKLIPSSRYQMIMEQNILEQAMSNNLLDQKKMLYLTMANLATLLLFGIIGIAVLF